MGQALREGVAAGELAQHQLALAQPDVAGAHDLVRPAELQDTVLVDAGFMPEGVFSDDGLVGLDGQAGQRTHQPGRLVDLPRVDAGRGLEEVLAHLQRHDDLLERGVARPLADAVDGAFHLAGAVLDRRQRVRHGQAEVVVAVHADRRPVDVPHMLRDALDEPAELLRNGESDGVRDVDRRRPCRDDGVQDLVQERRFGARGVLRRELHIARIALGVLHRPHGLLEDLLLGLVQFVLAVDRGRGQKHVDPLALGRRQCGGRRVDVRCQRARKGRDNRALHRLRDHLDRLGIAGRGDRKPAFDDVHAQPGELLRNLQLLRWCQTGAGRLFAIP